MILSTLSESVIEADLMRTDMMLELRSSLGHSSQHPLLHLFLCSSFSAPLFFR